MMSQDDLNPNPPDDSSGNSQKAACRPAEAPRCPRCDSPNTKFCYYNNYSLSQPRYFCKTCRRYWTKGGALRNIPIGGGCRKNKKMGSKSCSRFATDSMDSAGSSSYLDHLGGFKFSNLGLSSGMNNYQTLDSNLPRTFSPVQHYPQLSTNNSSFGNFSRTLSSPSCFNLDNQTANSSGSAFMGFNFPLTSSGIKQDHGSAQLLQDHDLDVKNNDVVASSIESLSSINQDLHWKLQQQRLGMMMFGEENNITDQKEVLGNTIMPPPMNVIPQKPQPILFENLEISSRVKDHDVHQGVGGSGSGNSGTEWLLDHNNSNHSLGNAAQTNSSNSGISTTGINQAWGNFYQYTPLP